MIEFITHESVHSWVLPFAEIWNEPIATYVGNLVMIDMGHEREALRRIESTIRRASRIDPTMKIYDLQGKGPAGTRELEQRRSQQYPLGEDLLDSRTVAEREPTDCRTVFSSQTASGHTG